MIDCKILCAIKFTARLSILYIYEDDILLRELRRSHDTEEVCLVINFLGVLLIYLSAYPKKILKVAANLYLSGN